MKRMMLRLPADFSLPHAVCSYGYYMLAPTRWDAAAGGSLHRPVHGEGGRIIQTISRQTGDRLNIVCASEVSAAERDVVAGQVARMLRLDEDPARFAHWSQLHPEARAERFGRLFRSPTLFEDIVKTFTGCNVTWANTITMNRLLCEHIGQGAFPTPGQLAATDPDRLKMLCKVGYRAERIIRLARAVVDGSSRLEELTDPSLSTETLEAKLRAIHGVGPYAAANILMLLGRYEHLAIDSETYRHFREKHGRKTPRTGAGLRRLHGQIRRHYERYAPFQFLAYWFELWGPPAKWIARGGDGHG